MKFKSFPQSTWKKPEDMIKELPDHDWSVLDMWALPDGLLARPEADHGRSLKAHARSLDGGVAPGSLQQPAPLSFVDAVIASCALSGFFVGHGVVRICCMGVVV